jgi:HD-like signal output (HDOD) protein
MTEQFTSHDRELSSEDIEQVFKTIDIPACPAMVAQVMAEAQKDVPDLKKLAKSIAADVGMSAVAIKLANSPLFRIGPPVGNVLKALERLGTRNTVCVVVAVALRATMAGMSPVFIEVFWNKTAALALAAGLIARRQYGISPDAAYTYALFHDAGIPLMMRRYPDYEKVLNECHTTGRLIIEAEDEYFPCTHPIIGSLLVRNWGLPPMVGQAIRFHHEPDVYDLPDKTLPGGAVSLIAVTHIAEHLANDLDGEIDLEVGPVLFERALAHLGIDGNEMEELREALLTARSEA